jgi:hypothetical protein
MKWNEVVYALQPVGPLTAIILWFRPWRSVIAPNGIHSALTASIDGVGGGLYQYKMIGSTCYNLSQSPSPGFPGN